MLQSSGDEKPNAQLAAAERSADASASRGAKRGPSDAANAIAAAAGEQGFGAPSDVADATSTTTTTSTSTPTTAPPARSAPVVPITPAAPKVVTPKPVPQAKAPEKAADPAIEVKTGSEVASSKDTGIVGDDVWARLARCESGGRNYSAGPYYGYFQFSPTTWRSIGGTGLPSDHTYLEQKALAIKLQARSGWGQWPVCSKKAGAV